LISIRNVGAAVLTSTLLLVAPASALANDGHDGPGGDRAERGSRGFGDVSARVVNKLRAAERAMDRAQDHADDAEPDASVAALAAVRRHLASASKSVARKVAAGNGAGAAAALARTQGNVVDGSIGLFDGAPDAIVAADAETLKAALDGRDALVAAIVALPDKSAYGWALRTIARDATSEAADIGEALTDDTLTDAAKAALTAAQAQATATAAAATAAAGTSATQSGTPGTKVAADGGTADKPRDCPPGAGRHDGDPGGGAPESEAAPAAA
jgi:hypothetical protein